VPQYVVMGDRVADHFAVFNAAVQRNDWTDFLATFTPDAVMSFEGIPVGPFAGRDAIAAAYAEQPPDDTMTCLSDDRNGDDDVVRFAWDAGGSGTMRVTWRDGKVATLNIAFDPR